MKRIVTPFLAAIIIGALALFGVYIESKINPQPKSDYLWYDTIKELNNMARLKYRQSIRYAQYSAHAEKEGLHNEATLLRAIAKADAIQCESCIKAINSLGGVYHSPVSVDANIQSTRQHLRLISDEKSAFHLHHIHHLITQTLNEGNRYIARMLTWCDASDIEQILILRHTLQQGKEADTLNNQYSVCPVCGNLTNKELTSYRCAHCMTPNEEFLIFK